MGQQAKVGEAGQCWGSRQNLGEQAQAAYCPKVQEARAARLSSPMTTTDEYAT